MGVSYRKSLCLFQALCSVAKDTFDLSLRDLWLMDSDGALCYDRRVRPSLSSCLYDSTSCARVAWSDSDKKRAAATQAGDWRAMAKLS